MYGDQEETSLKTVVSPARNTESTDNNNDLSPVINSSGNIVCGQPQHPLAIKEEHYSHHKQQPYDVIIYHNDTDLVGEEYDFDYIDGVESSGQAQIVTNEKFDELDASLDGLTKDTYIATLIQTTDGCEDTIAGYRAELSVRAKRCNNGPVGSLITRRSTAKGSVVEKYTNDCFLLHQFINGNTSDVNELFKANTLTSRPNNTQCSGNDGNIPVSLSAEITLMKESISQLLADVTLLKGSIAKTQDSLDSIGKTMKSDIGKIKNELETCKTSLNGTINATLFPQVVQNDLLSAKLAHIGRMVTKLDKSRMALEKATENIQTQARDNANGICNLTDDTVSGKNNVKGQTKVLKDKIENITEDVNLCNINKKENEDKVTQVARKVNSMEKKLNDSAIPNLQPSFDKLADNLATKIDKLCSVVEKSFSDKTPFGPNATLLRDNQSGIFTRIGNPDGTKSDTLGRTNVTEQPHRNAAVSKDKTVHSVETTSNSDNNLVTQCSIQTINGDKNNTGRRDIHGHDIQEARPIPVLGATSQGQGHFKGVLRRKIKNYFLTGIDQDSDEDGLRDYLDANGIIYNDIRMFKPRKGVSLAAKISIWEENASTIESESFWPIGIACKRWMTRPELRQINKQRSDNYYSEYNDYEPS